MLTHWITHTHLLLSNSRAKEFDRSSSMCTPIPGGLFASPNVRKTLIGRGKDPGPDPNANGQLEKPGLKVLHIHDMDFRSRAPTFIDALKQVRGVVAIAPKPCPHPDPGRAQGRRDSRVADQDGEVRA